MSEQYQIPASMVLDPEAFRRLARAVLKEPDLPILLKQQFVADESFRGVVLEHIPDGQQWMKVSKMAALLDVSKHFIYALLARRDSDLSDALIEGVHWKKLSRTAMRVHRWNFPALDFESLNHR